MSSTHTSQLVVIATLKPTKPFLDSSRNWRFLVTTVRMFESLIRFRTNSSLRASSSVTNGLISSLEQSVHLVRTHDWPGWPRSYSFARSEHLVSLSRRFEFISLSNPDYSGELVKIVKSISKLWLWRLIISNCPRLTPHYLKQPGISDHWGPLTKLPASHEPAKSVEASKRANKGDQTVTLSISTVKTHRE